MESAHCAKSRRFIRRTRTAQYCTATLIAAGVFALHPWFHSDFLGKFALTPRTIDAGAAFCVLLFFIGLQNLLSHLYFKDGYFGLLRAIDRHAPPTRPYQRCKQDVLPRIKEIPKYTGMLSAQLHSVTEQTEAAAVAIASRLHTIDAVVGELQQWGDAASQRAPETANPTENQRGKPVDRLEHEKQAPGGSDDRITVREKEALGQIRAASARLADMFMDTLTSVQFQDITRQQLVHVGDGLAHIDTHLREIARAIEDAEANDDDIVIAPLAESFDRLFSDYVMDAQREVHARALGSAPEGASPAGRGATAPNKVELF